MNEKSHHLRPDNIFMKTAVIFMSNQKKNLSVSFMWSSFPSSMIPNKNLKMGMVAQSLYEKHCVGYFKRNYDNPISIQNPKGKLIKLPWDYLIKQFI